jgi:hypothetical protein
MSTGVDSFSRWMVNAIVDFGIRIGWFVEHERQARIDKALASMRATPESLGEAFEQAMLTRELEMMARTKQRPFTLPPLSIEQRRGLRALLAAYDDLDADKPSDA